MDRRKAEYAPLRSATPRRRRRILRTAQLNVVGRTAVVGACLTAASLGFAAGRLVGLPVVATVLAGGLLPLAILAAADRRRWRAMTAVYGWGGTAAEVSAVAVELLRRGVVVTAAIDGDDDSASLCYRNADADVVSTVLAEHGIPGFDRWI